MGIPSPWKELVESNAKVARFAEAPTCVPSGLTHETTPTDAFSISGFHQFAALPQELQDLAWAVAATNETRAISFRESNPGDLYSNIQVTTSWPNNTQYYLDHKPTVPGFLQSCQDSRDVAMKVYDETFGGLLRRPVLFNYQNDIIELDGPGAQEAFLDILIDHPGNFDRQLVRNVSLTVREDLHEKTLISLCATFPALDYLMVRVRKTEQTISRLRSKQREPLFMSAEEEEWLWVQVAAEVAESNPILISLQGTQWKPPQVALGVEWAMYAGQVKKLELMPCRNRSKAEADRASMFWYFPNCTTLGMSELMAQSKRGGILKYY